MNQKITTLGHALLGLIRGEPRTGYALRKVFETTPMAHYSSSPGAIYPALRRLEELGLIEARVDGEARLRPKRVYRVTPNGVDALREWASQPVTRDQIVWREDELMLRFGFMGGLVPDDVTLRFLEELAHGLDERVVELLAYHESMPSDWPPHGRLAVEAGIEHTRAWAKWARRAMGEFTSPATGEPS